MTLGRRQRSLVGLDIGSSSVKVAELHHDGRGYHVSALGVEPLPPESIVDDVVVNGGAVREAIRRLRDRLGITRQEVAVSLSGSGVIVKKLSVPPMSDGELRESIQWEAQRHIPFEREDVQLDYQVLGRSTGIRGDAINVLLVAAKKARVDAYVSLITEAGCRPLVLDVDGFALQNVYELNAEPQNGRVVVLANAGASSINLNVVRAGESLFTRDVAVGGNAYTEALRREFDLDFATADRLKKGVPVGAVTYEDAEPVIEAVTQNLLQEVGKTLDFFRASQPGERVNGIVLSGGTSRIEGLARALADRFQTEVELFDPFRGIMADPSVLSEEERHELGPVVAIALGLATRNPDDR